MHYAFLFILTYCCTLLTVMTSAVYEMFTWTEFNVLRITFSNV